MPRQPKVAFTTRWVDSVEPERAQQDFSDASTPGLILRVYDSGSKSWMVRYRNDEGRRRMAKLGDYPVLSLRDARSEAVSMLASVQKGSDPIGEKRERRAAVNTFEALAREVLEARAEKTRPKTRRERQRILEVELLPNWADRPAASITRRDVVLLVEKIAKGAGRDRPAPVLANRTLALVRLIFNDGIRRGFPTVETNPAHLVEAPGEEEGRDRWLSSHELRAVWLATDAGGFAGLAFQFSLLTGGQRIGSVFRLRWDDVDGDVWRIPAAHFKGKRPHLVPLSTEALRVLDRIRAECPDDAWAFPSREGAKRPHLTNWQGALNRLRAVAGIPHWTAHDFRTTFRTHATRAEEDGGLGVAPEIADAILGHKEASLGFGRYTGDKERYRLHEKREGLEAWGAFVASVVEDES